MTNRRGLDAWLVDLTDAAVGRLQERGVPLPRVLAETGLATVAFVAAVIGVLVVTREWARAAFDFLCLAPWSIRFLSTRLGAYRSDEDRMDVQAVFQRYASKAVQEREAHLFLRPLCVAILVFLAIEIIVKPSPIDIMFGLVYLGFTSHLYCLCAYPRLPSRADAGSRDVAFGSAA